VRPTPGTAADRWSEADAWLIAYPDQFGAGEGGGGLAAVAAVMDDLAPDLNGVHVLPFHPSSSDGGFSVQDYAVIAPEAGTWDDVAALAGRHRLVADAVVNHVSAQGSWFRSHLAGEPDHADFFRVVPEGTDLSSVVRPRPGPPVTRFRRADGTEADYWTTFGADQVDLDYRNPDVLLAVFAAVFRYLDHGAAAIRLDAVAFLWKDPATPSMHRPETHAIVALLRDCVREIDPAVVLITETNVPHRDNIAYLGTAAEPEADGVYQFSLAPLVLHALHTGNVAPLRDWATTAAWPSGSAVFNFLAGHDGVGVRPARDWLTPEQVAALADRCREAGGVVNEAATAGRTEPYELAATWRSLCTVGVDGPFTDDELVARHLAGHAVALALRGIPLLYVHSLVASANARDRHAATGIARDLNRARFTSPEAFRAALGADDRISARAWRGLQAMLGWRRSQPVFHPDVAQRIHPGDGGVIVIERGPVAAEGALVAVNLTGHTETVDVGDGWIDLADGEEAPTALTLGPWSHRWFSRPGRPTPRPVSAR